MVVCGNAELMANLRILCLFVAGPRSASCKITKAGYLFVRIYVCQIDGNVCMPESVCIF